MRKSTTFFGAKIRISVSNIASVKRISLLLISVALLLTPVSAHGHAGVVGTAPTQDQVLNEMPKEISITFSEELLTIANQEVNTLSLTAFDGPSVELGNVIVAGSKISASIPSSEYAPGVYEVAYRAVSADGHTISGSYRLYLNTPSEDVAPVEKHQSFLHIHQGHITQGGVAIILIALWWAYRRFNREQGQ
jgi:methionine-rich copper-binding protein CopC